MPAHTLTYRPTASAHCSLLTAYWAARFTFSAKERDAETGLSYFGARYYSSDLSIWLSVDPMSDKYPSSSPYVYCANNPVKLVDPNGEDYEVVVDDKAMTITIKATYYTSNENKKTLQKGIDIWEAQSEKFTYTTGDDKNSKTYTIKFDLQIADRNYQTIDDAVKAFPLNGTSNLFQVFDELDDDYGNARGVTVGGNYIQFDKDYGIRTVAHEIGHTLGIIDDTFGLMESGGTNDNIEEPFIVQILSNSGIKCQYEWTWFCAPTVSAKCKTSYDMKGVVK